MLTSAAGRLLEFKGLSQRTPRRRDSRTGRVPAANQHLQFMGQEADRSVVLALGRGPPAEAPGGKAFLTKPCPLAVEADQPDRDPLPAPEHEHRATKGISSKAGPADLGQTVDSATEIHGLNCDEHFHLRRYLDHRTLPRKAPTIPAASRSRPASRWIRIRAPSGVERSIVAPEPRWHPASASCFDS